MAAEPGATGPLPPERLQAVLEETPLHRALGLQVTAADGHRLELLAHPGAEHAIGPDQLHGGVVATILDTAATFALIAATGTDWGTVDIRVDYLRPAPVGPLAASARVLHAGRRLGRASAEVADPATGRTVASAVGTFARHVQGES
jgi:uncharacterized protein (TIGR00369 family)